MFTVTPFKMEGSWKSRNDRQFLKNDLWLLKIMFKKSLNKRREQLVTVCWVEKTQKKYRSLTVILV